MSDAIAILESAYSLEGGEISWLKQLAWTVRQNVRDSLGIGAQTYDATQPGALVVRAAAYCRLNEEVAAVAAPLRPRRDECAALQSIFKRSFVGSLSDAARALRGIGLEADRVSQVQRAFDEYLRRSRLGDQWWVNGQDPTGHGCTFAVSVKTRGPRTREVHQWRCLAAHMVTAFRIRRQLAARVPDVPSADIIAPTTEAVLGPTGNVEYAAVAAQGEEARSSLREAVRTIDRARGRLRRSDPQQAVELWRALVAGRWSLLDHFDSDGRRFVVAHRNDAHVPGDARGLTPREQQILAYVALGHANKVIAYELGLSQSVVADHLARARHKLALRSLAGLQTT